MRRLLLASTAISLALVSTLVWPMGRILIFVKRPTPVGTLWSTLGVVDDGVTDNTAALNALPTNTTIIGDCPHSGTIYVHSNWIWQSNLIIYQQPGCQLTVDGGSGLGWITQSDTTTPVSNILYDGLSVKWLPGPNSAQKFRTFNLYANHLTLTNLVADSWPGFAFIRGSDQELGFCNVINPNHNVGNPGWRHMGNFPKVTTTGGRPANVWVHDCFIASGDGSFQEAPAIVGSWANANADDILVENSSGVSYGGNLIFIGEVTAACTVSDVSISNVVMKNVSGSGSTDSFRSTYGVQIANMQNSLDVSNITLDNITIDESTSNHFSNGIAYYVQSNSPRIGCPNLGGGVKSVTITNSTVTSPYATSFEVIGDTQDVSWSGGTIPANTLANSSVILYGGLRTSITNANIDAGGFAFTIGTALLGATQLVQSATITGNTIGGVQQNSFAMVLDTIDSGTITGNTFQPGINPSTSLPYTNTKAIKNGIAAGSDPGTTNTTETGNNVSALTASSGSKFLCAPGQGNIISGNTGATDCP